jgi:hypothetical protein
MNSIIVLSKNHLKGTAKRQQEIASHIPALKRLESMRLLPVKFAYQESRLGNNGEGGSALDLVADVLVLDDDASLRGVAAAAAAVDEEARATAHVIGAGRVKIVAVRHALEGVHVSKGVVSLRKRANALLALARRVVAARAAGSAAASGCVDVRSIVAGTIEVVLALAVCIRATSCDVQTVKKELLLALGHRSQRAVKVTITHDG